MGFSIKYLKSKNTFEFLTVRSAAESSGYNRQYLRRLLREGKFKTYKIGQIWLIDQIDFEEYLSRAQNSNDNRFGPNGQPSNQSPKLI